MLGLHLTLRLLHESQGRGLRRDLRGFAVETRPVMMPSEFVRDQ